MSAPHAAGELVNESGRKYLTRDERRRFLAAVRTHRSPSVRTLALTLAFTGCRVSEALALRACDVDLEALEVRFSTLKRRREHWRAVPVPETLVNALDLVHQVRAFQSSQRMRTRLLWTCTRQAAHRQVCGLMARAGVAGPQACPRGLRHAFGVACVQSGVPLTTIAAALGHADVATTAVYATAIGAEARELLAPVWGD